MKKEENKQKKIYISILVVATLLLLNPSGVYLERPSGAYIAPSTVPPAPVCGTALPAPAPAMGAFDPYEDILDSVPRLTIGEGHGSAVTIAWDGTFSYLLTAAHVVEGYNQEDHNCLQGVRLGRLYHYPVQVYAVYGEADLAIVVTPYKMDVLPLGEEPKLQDTVLAVGYPNSVFPAIFSIGVVRNPLYDQWVYHSAGVWFGNSGGPLLDFEGLSVIGINVVIFTVDIPGQPSSNHVGAVPLSHIRKFLEIHGLD